MVMGAFLLELEDGTGVAAQVANQLEAIKDVADYIVGLLQLRKRHSALGNTAPLVYEKVCCKTNDCSV
ncbi:MAG: hypothetical protein IPP36_07360 [Nitrosomonadales bacterium]|nr:hypothetical protein [Nitrosomonadales bacterium]